MSQHQADPAPGRRGFLRSVLVAGGGTALTTLFASRLVAEVRDGTAVRKTPRPASRGYHETAHVRDYYRTLRE